MAMKTRTLQTSPLSGVPADTSIRRAKNRTGVEFAKAKGSPTPTGNLANIVPGFAKPVYVTMSQIPDERMFHGLVASVLRSRWFTNNGRLVRALEDQLKRRLGVAFCSVFCNGTMALEAALRSLDLSGEVITTPFTFPATVHAITWTGLTPVFCDIDPNTYNIDVEQAADLISARTSAILPVHVFGNPCDVVAIERLARLKGIKVVYDAAHAFGVSYLGRSIGSWGDLSVLSFHATKLFHTCEGGAVVGSERSRFAQLALLRNFGIAGEEEVTSLGVNGKLSEIHAAMGLALLNRTANEIRSRGQLASRYRERLVNVEGLTFQQLAPGTVPNNGYFTVEIDERSFGLSREQVHLALRASNIITRKYFFPLCSENPCYRHLQSAEPNSLPNAHRLASRILCLPLYGDLTLDDVDKIADCLLAVKSAGRLAVKSAGRRIRKAAVGC